MKVTSHNTMRRSPETIQFVAGDLWALYPTWI
jgi:hypothetical protein